MIETLFNVVDLRRRLGQRRELSIEAHLDDIVVGSTFVPADEPVELSLVAESVPDGVVVEGTIRARYEGECRRCLDPVTGTIEIAARELFAEHGDPDETYAIDHDVIDLAPMARDALMLNLPQLPLCRDDCAGPAPNRYPARPASDEPPVDPRWSALSELDL